MKTLLLCVAVSMMFSGGHSYSESMSCSTINGKTICNSEKGSGNIAGSSSSAIIGDGVSYQDSYAMRGDSGTGQAYSSRSQRGNPPNGGFGPNQFFGPAYGPQGSSSSSSSSRSSSYGNDGGNAGNGNNGAYASNGNNGAYASNGNNGAYASNGNNGGYARNGNGAFASSQAGAGSFAGPMPNYGFDPFAFAGLPNPMFGFGFAGRR